MIQKRKIVNDPVFGFINAPEGLLLDIINHPYMQRLARIKQMGFRRLYIRVLSIQDFSIR